MASNYWLLATGQGDWTDIANWSLGVAPVSTDAVFILQGNSDIQLHLPGHSAVVLASLTIGGSFSGTIASDATAQTAAPLAIGIATGGIVTINCPSQRIWLDFGTSQPVIDVDQTGNPQSQGFGGEAVQIRGCSSAATIVVSGAGSSVGFCTTLPGLTGTVASISINDGTLNVGAGASWTNILQSGNASHSGGVVSTYGGGTVIEQSGAGTLNTFGASAITTMVITGEATVNHRPASGTDAIATLSIGPGAKVDFSKDPRPCTITNTVIMAKGASLLTFAPNQVALHSAVLKGRTQLCDLSDISLSVGGPVEFTITNY